MKTRNSIFWILGTVALLSTCSDPSDNTTPKNPQPEYIAPPPPETIDPGNVVQVTIFSTLTDEPLFASQETTAIAKLINEANRPSLLYLFERSDFQLGKPLPQVEIGLAARSYSLFSQIEPTSESVKGTGMVTRNLVEAVDAVHEEGLYSSGCTLSAPFAQPTRITIYTARFEKRTAFETLVARRSSVLQTSGIIIGSIRNDIRVEVETWLRWNLRNYRIDFADSKSSPYDLFVLTPVGFVCRSIELRTEAVLPYFNISIEKI